MTSAITSICTTDGIWIARDAITGFTASGRNQPEAVAELKRLIAGREAA